MRRGRPSWCRCLTMSWLTGPSPTSPCSFFIDSPVMHDLSVDGFAERTVSGALVAMRPVGWSGLIF